jgi:hypothetical protein
LMGPWAQGSVYFVASTNKEDEDVHGHHLNSELRKTRPAETGAHEVGRLVRHDGDAKPQRRRVR